MIIIASDYDETLNCNGISQKDRDAIEKFRQAGNVFAIVTGRDLEATRWITRRDFPNVDFIICCTGALIMDTDENVIYRKTSQISDAFSEIIEKANECGTWYFNVSDGLEKQVIDTFGKMGEKKATMKEFTHCNTWFPTLEGAQKFIAWLKENHPEQINAFQNGQSVDMPPAGVSKASGVRQLASMYDNPKIYTVGDQWNDEEMLRAFESFAVENAQPEIKAIATHQTGRICDMIETIMKEEKIK